MGLLAPERHPWTPLQASAVAGALALGVLSLGFILWGVADLDKDGTNNMAELQAGSNPFRSPASDGAQIGEDGGVFCDLGLEECPQAPAEPAVDRQPAERAIWATSGFALLAVVVACYGGFMVRKWLLR